MGFLGLCEVYMVEFKNVLGLAHPRISHLTEKDKVLENSLPSKLPMSLQASAACVPQYSVS